MLICLHLHALCFMPSFMIRSTSLHASMLRSIFLMCGLARSTCFYVCLHVYFSFLHVSCFMPYFPMFFFLFCSMAMWGLHAHMFASMLLTPSVLRSICLDVRSHAHMLDIMSMVMPCLDLQVCMHFLRSYAYIYAFTCLYAWICVLPCFHAYIHMLRRTCLHAYFYAYMCRSMCLHACFLAFMFYMFYATFHVLVHSMPCLCA